MIMIKCGKTRFRNFENLKSANRLAPLSLIPVDARKKNWHFALDKLMHALDFDYGYHTECIKLIYCMNTCDVCRVQAWCFGSRVFNKIAEFIFPKTRYFFIC